MNIPVIELLAQICIGSEPDIDPPTTSRREVKQRLRSMFEPIFGQKTAYAVERLIVAAKAVGLVEERDGELVAIIKPKTTRHDLEDQLWHCA